MENMRLIEFVNLFLFPFKKNQILINRYFLNENYNTRLLTRRKEKKSVRHPANFQHL